MAEVDLNDLGKIGLVTDVPGYQLPPEAWTTAENIRYNNGTVERFSGWGSTFGTPPDNVYFTLPLITSSQNFWLWTSLTAAYVWDGLAHNTITRLAGPYSAGQAWQWQGIVLGGIPILNNGVNAPQAWMDANVAVPLVDLPDWPSSMRARRLLSFGNFLVAFNVTKGSTTYPHMVKWSNAAEPGTLPSSWDETDPTVEAGENDLPDVNSGSILEALPLQSTMFIYKQGSVWQMNYIGGQFIFDFKTFLDTVGIMASNCVCVTGDGKRHVFLTQDDAIWHNGNQSGSILDGKHRRRMFNEIDPSNYINSFVFCNPLYGEVWICYPTLGNTIPNKAIVWNYQGGGSTLSEITGINFIRAAYGAIESASAETWADNPSETWDEFTGPWSQVTRRQVILSSGTTKFYTLDQGLTKDGTTFTATLQREGLSLLGKKRDGGWIVDHEVMKMVDSVWPKIRNGTVRLRIGSQMTVNGPIAWSDYSTFDSTADIVAYLQSTGRAIAIEFSSNTDVLWSLDGYKFNVKELGRF